VLETYRVRPVNGLTGSGVTVGILSDSLNELGGYNTDVSTGDLRNNVNILQGAPRGARTRAEPSRRLSTTKHPA
jgi:hypothetical protein